MKGITCRFVPQLIFILLSCAASAYAQPAGKPPEDVNSLFLKANQVYQEARYQEAAGYYAAVLAKKENGYLYFNLGNCYFKMSEIGQAVLNYRRAQRFIPRFEDLVMNLKYARQECRDKIEDKSYSQLLRTLFFWHYQLNRQELLICFLILNFLVFSLAGLRLYTQTDIVKWLLLLVGIVYLTSAVSLATRIYQDKFQQAGVVIGKEIAVRSGSDTSNVVLFKLHSGTELMVEKVKSGWLKIRLADGKIGWVQKSGVGII